MRSITSLAKTILLILILAVGAQAGTGSYLGPEIKLETAEVDHKTGQVTLKMTVEVRDLTKEIAVKIMGDSSLVPEGAQEFSQLVGDQDMVEFLFPFNVTQYDTMRVMFFVIEKTGIEGFYSREHVVKRGDRTDTIKTGPQQGDEVFPMGNRYFVRTPDTLMVLTSHPSRSKPMSRHLETPNAKSTPLVIPDSSRTIPADGVYRIPPDDTKVLPAEGWSSETDKPLRGYSGQIITTDSGDYRRYEGETEFHRVPVTSDYDMLMSPMKVFVDTVTAGEKFEILIDLRDPDHKATADRLIHARTPAATEGWYRARINKRAAQELLENHVVFVRYGQTDGREGVRNREDRTSTAGDSINESENDPPPAPPNSTSTASGYDLLWENFETGDWSTRWYAVDLMEYGGWDTWGRSEYRDHNGIASAWCSGYGQMNDGEGYAPYSYAYLTLREPIDVFGLNQIEIEWAYYADVPFGRGVTMLVERNFYEDEGSWTNIEIFDVSADWTVRTWLINAVSDEVRLRFSCITYDWTGYDGYYVDDIKVREVSFNLLPYMPVFPQPYWDYPVLPSSIYGQVGGSVQ